MYRITVILAATLLVGTVGGVVFPVVGAAAAQEGSALDGEANSSDTAESNKEERTILHELGPEGDPGAYITDITWDGRTVKITIEAIDYTTLSINDAGSFVAIDEGSSGEVPYETYTIPSGETRTIEFDVADGTGVKAVAITAHGTMIGSVEDGYGLLSGSASWTEVQAAASAGILSGAGIPLLVTAIIAIAGRWNHQRVF
jgi:hypothetical protein